MCLGSVLHVFGTRFYLVTEMRLHCIRYYAPCILPTVRIKSEFNIGVCKELKKLPGYYFHGNIFLWFP